MAKRKDTSVLVGRKIFSISKMTPTVLAEFGWQEPGSMLILDDGTIVFASSDHEGNRAGVLFGESEVAQSFYVDPDPNIRAALAGRSIRAVSRMLPEQLERQGWTHEAAPLMLDLGSVKIFPSKDDEGNGPGVISVRQPDGKSFFARDEGPREWSPRRP